MFSPPGIAINHVIIWAGILTHSVENWDGRRIGPESGYATQEARRNKSSFF
jgi:hypothetical protein